MTDGFDLPGAESTSAALRRVEAELGSALSALSRSEQQLAECRALLAKYLTNGIEHALTQMDNHVRAADGWLRLACGDFTTRPGGFNDHPCGAPGPMPVRLTITHRTEGAPPA